MQRAARSAVRARLVFRRRRISFVFSLCFPFFSGVVGLFLTARLARRSARKVEAHRLSKERKTFFSFFRRGKNETRARESEPIPKAARRAAERRRSSAAGVEPQLPQQK